MLKELIANAAILISSISLGNAFLKKTCYAHDKILQRVLMGLLTAALGCILILFSIPVGSSLIVDLRFIPVFIAAFYYPLSSLTITTAVICGFRIFAFGVTPTSITGGLSVVAVALVCALLIKLLIKWTIGVAWVCVTAAVSLLILDVPPHAFWLALVGYAGGHIVVGFGIFFYLQYVTKVNDAFRQLHIDSKTDFLTGLNNFRQCDKSLNKHYAAAVDGGNPLSILFIDIDNFKHVNDTYGHLAGDQILRTLGRQLKTLCRATDIVCRRGGEEFTVILPHCQLAQAHATAERIRENVAAHRHTLTDGTVISISVSIGVSCYPETSIQQEELIEHADTALYRAKHSGKNTVISA
jgi:diguanylate cyclase